MTCRKRATSCLLQMLTFCVDNIVFKLSQRRVSSAHSTLCIYFEWNSLKNEHLLKQKYQINKSLGYNKCKCEFAYIKTKKQNKNKRALMSDAVIRSSAIILYMQAVWNCSNFNQHVSVTRFMLLTLSRSKHTDNAAKQKGSFLHGGKA